MTQNNKDENDLPGVQGGKHGGQKVAVHRRSLRTRYGMTRNNVPHDLIV
jgi:hypothetical protein